MSGVAEACPGPSHQSWGPGELCLLLQKWIKGTFSTYVAEVQGLPCCLGFIMKMEASFWDPGEPKRLLRVFSQPESN